MDDRRRARRLHDMWPPLTNRSHSYQQSYDQASKSRDQDLRHGRERDLFTHTMMHHPRHRDRRSRRERFADRVHKDGKGCDTIENGQLPHGDERDTHPFRTTSSSQPQSSLHRQVSWSNSVSNAAVHPDGRAPTANAIVTPSGPSTNDKPTQGTDSSAVEGIRAHIAILEKEMDLLRFILGLRDKNLALLNQDLRVKQQEPAYQRQLAEVERRKLENRLRVAEVEQMELENRRQRVEVQEREKVMETLVHLQGHVYAMQWGLPFQGPMYPWVSPPSFRGQSSLNGYHAQYEPVIASPYSHNEGMANVVSAATTPEINAARARPDLAPEAALRQRVIESRKRSLQPSKATSSALKDNKDIAGGKTTSEEESRGVRGVGNGKDVDADADAVGGTRNCGEKEAKEKEKQRKEADEHEAGGQGQGRLKPPMRAAEPSAAVPSTATPLTATEPSAAMPLVSTAASEPTSPTATVPSDARPLAAPVPSSEVVPSTTTAPPEKGIYKPKAHFRAKAEDLF